jgi:hypothetical protein
VHAGGSTHHVDDEVGERDAGRPLAIRASTTYPLLE